MITGTVITPLDSITLNVSLIPFGYQYLPGDVNMSSGTWPPAATGPDVTYLVNFFRGVLTSVPCKFDGDIGLFWASADANGDCFVTGPDVTFLVQYFRSAQPALLYCADYPPLWLTPGDVPDPLPDGFPFCDLPLPTSIPTVIPNSMVK